MSLVEKADFMRENGKERIDGRLRRAILTISGVVPEVIIKCQNSTGFKIFEGKDGVFQHVRCRVTAVDINEIVATLR